ncbi:MAG: AAA family ATPase, partial [Clostridia bacterium]|nr:AAA family ATPase [Clostridia bacterium]
MTYKVLYREWRPQNFAQITGQEPITLTLQNAVLSQRIAHAYLFCGPRGTGKTSTAKVFAKALNCLNRQGAEPCGQCSNCQEITLGSSMDVIEIDAASNRGIDEVREIRENVKFLPASGFKRVYIIDELHMAIYIKDVIDDE